MKYMNERRLLCELGRRMWTRGWVAANDGNLSQRLPDGRFLATPAGVSKGFMTPDMILLLDGEGLCLDEGSPWAPTSEFLLHRKAYLLRPEMGAVCHAHPPAATAFACARTPIDAPILGETLMTLGTIPVAPYARTGSAELPKAAAPLLKRHFALLLANHGALTLGRTPEEAYHRMETVELTAQIHLNARLLGGGVPLAPEEIEALTP